MVGSRQLCEPGEHVFVTWAAFGVHVLEFPTHFVRFRIRDLVRGVDIALLRFLRCGACQAGRSSRWVNYQSHGLTTPRWHLRADV